MKEGTIRRAFHHTILKNAHLDCQTIVVDELGLKNGGIRADIAVLNGKLVGYEIKTQRDNLYRLPAQVEAYSDVFDKAFIIVSENHLERSLKLIPDWWGVYKIEMDDMGDFSFSLYRKACQNKYQNSFTLARLLWKPEAINLASSIKGKPIKKGIVKHDLYKLISSTYSEKKLSKLIIKYLKQRDNWRVDRSQLL